MIRNYSKVLPMAKFTGMNRCFCTNINGNKGESDLYDTKNMITTFHFHWHFHIYALYEYKYNLAHFFFCAEYNVYSGSWVQNDGFPLIS